MPITRHQRAAHKRTIIAMLEDTPAATEARPDAPSQPSEPLGELDFDWRPRPLDRAVGTRRTFRWSILAAAAVLGVLAMVAVQVLVTVPQQRADVRRAEYRAALDDFEAAVAEFADAPAPSDPEALRAFTAASAAFAEIARAELPTVIPLLPIGPIEELRPARTEMLAIADAADQVIADLASASTYRAAAADILDLPLLPAQAPEELIDPAARAIADMQSATERAYGTLDDDPAYAAYRDRVAEAIAALPDWSDSYLLALRRDDPEATAAVLAEFQGRVALAAAELDAAVADVDGTASAAVAQIAGAIDEVRLRLG